MTSEGTLRGMVLRHFQHAGLTPASVNVRSFPGETIVVVEVDDEFARALSLAEELDSNIENGFVTVRQSQKRAQKKPATNNSKENI